MSTEFSGIERRLDELSDRLARLEPLTDKTRAEFEGDPYLRDIVERNLEIAAQCCLDIAHRIISLERARKPVDYYDAILRLGELEVLWGLRDGEQGADPIAASFCQVLLDECTGVEISDGRRSPRSSMTGQNNPGVGEAGAESFLPRVSAPMVIWNERRYNMYLTGSQQSGAQREGCREES